MPFLVPRVVTLSLLPRLLSLSGSGIELVCGAASIFPARRGSKAAKRGSTVLAAAAASTHTLETNPLVASLVPFRCDPPGEEGGTNRWGGAGNEQALLVLGHHFRERNQQKRWNIVVVGGPICGSLTFVTLARKLSLCGFYFPPFIDCGDEPGIFEAVS